ncbi:hypothetical protein ASF59_20135 [Methylobacterium sp. Leaf121]|nr:hypothetical protein ASF59_20135 [Methylobacterium sp. Leaf121]
MAQHTPGPWINLIGGPIVAYGSVDTFSEAVLIPVAVCKPLQDHDSDGRHYTLPGCPAANNRLVAAARDLFDALKSLLLVHRQMMSGGAMPADTGIALGKAEAALAKVEG